MASREHFSTNIGFVLAAAGSAVGLGNIWGFPTMTAANGGAAFVLVYLVLAFCLAYPVLMAELVIGRHANANAVTALRNLSRGRFTWWLGSLTGFGGVIAVSLILGFYSIVAGWMLAYLLAAGADLVGFNTAESWLTRPGMFRDVIFTLTFMAVTIAIVTQGINKGIERWSVRLMPALFVILLLLIVYVSLQNGAVEGLRVYLLPDFSHISPALVLNAMGQAFFSMSLGVGGMLIYGSYLAKDANLPRMGAIVTLVDVSIAFLAGLLIIPAMYVAQHYGAEIFDSNGALFSGPDMIFRVLPVFFDSMGSVGPFAALAFFSLMTIAAITSSIAMLEPSVCLLIETKNWSRKRATWLIGSIITPVALVILSRMDLLFGFVASLTTKYSQPLLGTMFCIFLGWIWHRNEVLKEVRQGAPDIEHSLFWKIWPFYIKWFCPVFIIGAFVQKILMR